VGLGPVFATATKRLRRTPGGPDLVRAALGATRLPLYPIGGVTLETAPSLVAAGAVRLAVSSAVCAAADPGAATRALLRVVEAESVRAWPR
jgi:thiamine-phosphate pyrophosphorylase